MVLSYFNTLALLLQWKWYWISEDFIPFYLWSKCVVSRCCKTCWDTCDPDHLTFHYQYSSSSMKCFSVVTELLKCEGYACDSAIKLSNCCMCCNSTGKVERGERSWQCWSSVFISATYLLWDICLCLISAILFFLSVEQVSFILFFHLIELWVPEEKINVAGV